MQHKAKGGSVPHLAVGGQGPKNWMKGSVEQIVDPLKQTVGFMTPDRIAEQQRSIDKARRILGDNAPRATLEQMEREIQQSHRVDAMNQWVNRNLTNYIKKQMATHEDPIRKLAEQGIVHKQMGNQRDLGEVFRKQYGDPQLGQSPEAQAWEDAADASMDKHIVGDILAVKHSHAFGSEPWMEKADPSTKVFLANNNMNPNYLGFDHMVDVLKQDLAKGRIRPEQLNKMSIEQAVRRVHQYDQERKKAMAETALKATEGMPVHKEYPEGYKWIELTLSPEEKEKAKEYEARTNAELGK
jgi:flagellin-specific chaperone FliS